MSPCILPLFAHIPSSRSVFSIAVNPEPRVLSLYVSPPPLPLSVHFLNVSACFLPMFSHILSHLSLSIGVSPSRSQPHVLSLPLCVSFLNRILCALPAHCLHTSSHCLRTSLSHSHSALTQLADTAHCRTEHNTLMLSVAGETTASGKDNLHQVRTSSR